MWTKAFFHSLQKETELTWKFLIKIEVDKFNYTAGQFIQIKINDLIVIHMSTVPLWEGKNVCDSPNQALEWILLSGRISPDSTYVVKKLIEQIKRVL